MGETIRSGAKRLRSLWSGFFSSRVILTANNLRVFDRLPSPQTAQQVARALKTDARATEILLDALTGLDLLKKRKGYYSNSTFATRFLTAASPLFQGDIIKHADTLWENWSGLDRVIKTGKPNHRAHDHEAFIRGMDNLALLKAGKVVRTVGLRGVRQALDLGGGPGTYALEMAKKGVHVTIFDRPETIRIARQVIKKSGVGNIGFIEGDFLSDDIGRGYDLILISQVLHACSTEECRHVIAKSREALNAGGRIAVQEFYIRENRARPAQSALFSINMLVNTDAGRCYASSEIGGWLDEAGFVTIRERMVDDSALVTGSKPGPHR